MDTHAIYQVISIVSSISSLVLAFIAIWLSLAFFKMTTTASQNTTEAAKGIGASVERLEKLFDKLYTDTFSIVRETVSDMRKHAWPEQARAEDEAEEQATEDTEKKADEKIIALRHDMEAQLQRLFDRQGRTDENAAALREEMQQLIERAIKSSRLADVEAREETARKHVLAALKRLWADNENIASAIDLNTAVNLTLSRMITELRKLKDEGLIELSDDKIKPDTLIAPRRAGFAKTHETKSSRSTF